MFKEFNNREIANKHAEFITSLELRSYLADKVEKYCGENITVFDPTAGSGQLAQFINPSYLVAVEIQNKACLALQENYQASTVHCMSFFNYKGSDVCDAVIMNPPYSLKLKDLSDAEQKNVQDEFEWKKSGVVDDIFVLKSLKHTKRYGFYILFPGLAYRRNEQKFRDLLGSKIVELNRIQNGFEDTKIEVLFLVIDKQKQNRTVNSEIYDCNSKEVLAAETIYLTEIWQTAIIEKQKEVVDIDSVNIELTNSAVKKIREEIEKNIFLNQVFDANIDVVGMIKNVRQICDECEKKLVN